MVIKEYSNGAQIQENQALILGVSINNSLFTNNEYLIKILTWASLFSKKTYIMIPDEPAQHTFMAIGYEEKKAENKARLKSNNIQNRCIEILKNYQIANVSIIRWKDIVGNVNYQNSLSEIEKAYQTDISFQEALRSTTSEVLFNSLKKMPQESNIDIGINFLLKELAFICYANSILNEERIAYIYHNTMVVMKNIFDGRYSFKASPGNGFLTVE